VVADVVHLEDSLAVLIIRIFIINRIITFFKFDIFWSLTWLQFFTIRLPNSYFEHAKSVFCIFTDGIGIIDDVSEGELFWIVLAYIKFAFELGQLLIMIFILLGN